VWREARRAARRIRHARGRSVIRDREVGPAGLNGDGHDHEKHNTPVQAICLIDEEDLDDLRREGFDVGPGAVGENLTVRGLEVDRLRIGDVLRLSGGVELRLTKWRKPCYVLDAISPELKTAIAGRCGAYAEVVRGGAVRAGERIEVVAETPAERA
jgi:MOSC domain-containing protein YiiM